MANSTFTKAQKKELIAIISTAVAEAMKDVAPKAVGKKAVAETPKKGKGAKAEPKPILSYEPKKSPDGNYNWTSYKSNRTKYCYYIATNGEVKDGKVFGTKWYDKVDFSDNSAYYKAKAEFEKTFKYIKIADR